MDDSTVVAAEPGNPPEPASASADSAQRASVGVLFVHGIGVQPRGATLAEFGGPIIQWLSDWYDGLHGRWVEAGLRPANIDTWMTGLSGSADPRRIDALRSLRERAEFGTPDDVGRPVDALASNLGELLAVSVRLTDTTSREDTLPIPAHGRLRWTHLRVDGSVRETNWLLAESWWADAFHAPSFRELATWGVAVLPRTIGSHLGVALARACRRWPAARLRTTPEVALRAVNLVLGMVASLGAIVVLLGLLVVSLIPIPAVRSAVANIQMRLAASVGDAYVLVTRPIEAASIVTRVQQDLRWLAERCDQIVIVAHSQGGAVVAEVLRQELALGSSGLLVDPEVGDEPAAVARPRLTGLITFGSGLRKLDELRQLLGPGHGLLLSGLLTLAGIVSVGVGVLGTLLAITTPASPASVGVTLLYAGIGLAISAAGLADFVTSRPSGELTWWLERLRGSGLRWWDIAASADPVSNGSLIENATDDPQFFPRHLTVHNRGSSLRDHTTYWKNRDEFIAQLLLRLIALDPAVATDIGSEEQRLVAAARIRRWRVRWWIGCRWLAAAAVAVAVASEPAVWLGYLGVGYSHVEKATGLTDDAVPMSAIALLPLLRVSVVLGAWLLCGWAWSAADRQYTAAAIARRRPGRQRDATFMMCIAVLVCAAAWAVGHDVVADFGSLLPGMFVGSMLAAALLSGLTGPKDLGRDEDPDLPIYREGHGVQVSRLLWRLAGPVSIAVLLGLTLYDWLWD